MTNTKQDKPNRKDLDQKVMDGVDAHLASIGTLTINGEQFTPATLKAVFQAGQRPARGHPPGRAVAFRSADHRSGTARVSRRPPSRPCCISAGRTC